MEEQKRLEELFEKYKNDLDGGFLNALVEFSEEAFNKLKIKKIEGDFEDENG